MTALLKQKHLLDTLNVKVFCVLLYFPRIHFVHAKHHIEYKAFRISAQEDLKDGV